MKRNYLYSSLSVILAAIVGLSYTLAVNNRPLLGLDLQGGVSVVLSPKTPANSGQLDQTVELLRGRIDEIGVAEPEISRQGQNIVVALPGVIQDQEQALDRLSQTAKLEFRPVIFEAPLQPDSEEPDQSDESGEPSQDQNDNAADADSDPDGDVLAGDEADSSPEAATDDESEQDAGSQQQSLGLGRLAGALGFASLLQDSSDPSEEDVPQLEAEVETPELDIAGGDTPAEGEEPPELDPQQQAIQQAIIQNCLGEPTPRDDIVEQGYLIIENAGIRTCLGPTELTGDALETAVATLDPFNQGEWVVNPTFKSGPDGIDLFNDISGKCYRGEVVCPPTTSSRGRLAAVLDNTIVSSPSINAETFRRDEISISGTMGQEEAERVAEALKFGALPVELVAQETRTVSASIGGDVLRSGTLAGIIGLSVVAVYLLFYYRLAGLVAIGGLGLSAALLWTIVSWFGEQYGLALSIAGVVGLIVSIGVSTDSNIVYFENVKETVRGGAKLLTSVERAYHQSISTIIKADVVSLIAAVLLYFLAVGAVRGFAFYLGLATLLDLLISIGFMRPALVWIARRGFVQANPKWLGIRGSK